MPSVMKASKQPTKNPFISTLSMLKYKPDQDAIEEALHGTEPTQSRKQPWQRALAARTEATRSMLPGGGG